MVARTVYLFNGRRPTVWVEAFVDVFVNIAQNVLMLERQQIFIYSHTTGLCSHLDLFSSLQTWSTPSL